MPCPRRWSRSKKTRSITVGSSRECFLIYSGTHTDALISKYNITYISKDPLLYIIDNFLSAEECEDVMASTSKLERSTGGLERSVTSYRTSSTAWVNTRTLENPKIKRSLENIENRISELTGYPVDNQVFIVNCLYFISPIVIACTLLSLIHFYFHKLYIVKHTGTFSSSSLRRRTVLQNT